MIHVNLLANIELLRLLKLHGNIASWAKIFTIGSQASKHFFSGWAVYQASKWWLRGFIGSLRKEWKQYQLYLIHPQIVETRFFRSTRNWVIPSNLPRTKKEDIIQLIDSILHLQGNYNWEIDC
jgi:short-subunit dehydrogenase